MKEKLSPLLILLAAVLWGTTGTAQTLAPETAHPIAIGAARLAIGGFPLFLIVLIRRQLELKDLPMKSTLLSALCMAIYQPLFFSAVTITGVAVGTVVAIGSAPVLSGVIEWLILKKNPSRIWWYSTSLSVSGCLLLFINKESVNVNPYGFIMALGAGLSFACYSIASRELVKKCSSLSVVAVVFSLSAVFLSPVLFLYDMSWLIGVRGMAVSLHLGVAATGIAYYLFTKGLQHVPSSIAVTLALGEPLTATILGVVLVGEHLDFTSWMGVTLLILGIGLLVFKSKDSDNMNINMEISR